MLVASVGRNLTRLTNRLEPVAIGSLAALNRHCLDTCAHEANLVDDLRLLKLDGQLLWEHARGQPELIIVPTKVITIINLRCLNLLEDVRWVKSLIEAGGARDFHFLIIL